uniref:Uncharacterized protein n=1 Tax=viral metagenome TaxID=1070528 RepID=A0A6C0BQ63_9ZZZZ
MSVVDVLWRILSEILALVLLGLFLYYMVRQFPVRPYEDELPPEPWDPYLYRSGDLIITFGDYLASIHPGHMSLVVQVPPYHQLFVWDLDSQEQTYILKPLMPFLEKNYKANRKVFVRHLDGPYSLDLLPILRKYGDINYEYQGVLDYCNYLLHKYLALPGLPTVLTSSNDKQHHFYCSEVVLRVLIDAGACQDDIFYNIPDLDHHSLSAQFHLIYPKYFLHSEFQINEFMEVGFNYQEARAVSF